MSETPNPPVPPNEPQSGAPVPPSPSAPATAATPGPAMGETADVEKNKVFAALAYLGLLFLVPLLAAKDSPFAKYHTNQGIALFLVTMVAYVVVVVMHFIPFVGWCAGCV